MFNVNKYFIHDSTNLERSELRGFGGLAPMINYRLPLGLSGFKHEHRLPT